MPRESKLKGKKQTEVIAQDMRLSFPYLIKPDVSEMGGGKYAATFLWPKENKQLTEVIDQAVENAKADGVDKYGKNFLNRIKRLPKEDGDAYAAKKGSGYDMYKGHWFLKAKSKRKPMVVDRNKELILEEEDIPSGSFVNVDFACFSYDHAGNAGISCALNSVQKIKCRPEDRFDGVSTADNFDVIEEDDDDLGF